MKINFVYVKKITNFFKMETSAAFAKEQLDELNKEFDKKFEFVNVGEWFLKFIFQVDEHLNDEVMPTLLGYIELPLENGLITEETNDEEDTSSEEEEKETKRMESAPEYKELTDAFKDIEKFIWDMFINDFHERVNPKTIDLMTRFMKRSNNEQRAYWTDLCKRGKLSKNDKGFFFE